MLALTRQLAVEGGPSIRANSISPGVVEALLLVRLPYHLSAITQAVALAALRHSGELLASVAAIRADRDQTVSRLREIGLTAGDSDANFVLFGRFAELLVQKRR